MNRHSYLKLIFAFKILNNHVFCPFAFFTYHPNNKQLLHPFAKTFYFPLCTLYLLLNCGTVYLQTLLLVQV